MGAEGDERRTSYRGPVAFYLAMTSFLLALQHVSNRVLRQPGYHLLPWQGLRFYVDGWSQFDGVEYERIAEFGYSYVATERSNIVWFPLYPMLMRATERLVGDYLVAGIVVATAGGVLAVCAFWAWLGQMGITGRTRRIAFAVIVLYPYGWYLYGAVHADSLFVGLLVLAFILVERDRLVWAGLVAALATATRPTGMAIIPAMAVFGLTRHGVLRVPEGATGWVARLALPIEFDRSRLRASTFAPLLSATGLGAWCTFLWIRWGNPIAFITNERLYHPGDKPLLKREFVYRWLHFSDDPTYALTIAGQALVVAFVIWSVPAVCRRFGFAYGFFVAVLVAIPTVSTENFMGTGRYLMAAVPVMALWGERLAERTVARRVWLSTSAVLMIGMAALFARSTYLT